MGRDGQHAKEINIMTLPPDYLWYVKRQAKARFSALLSKPAPQAYTLSGYVQGVDISKWNGLINWDLLSLKADFVYIRAGYGNDYVDPRLVENITGALTTGVPFGLYWFLVPGKSWEAQAFNFYNHWWDAGGTLPPVFDVEVSGGLGKTALDSWLYKCYNKFKVLSGLDWKDIATYTSPGFLNKAMPLTNWMKWTKLWVAHWTTGQPTIPNEWAVPGFTWWGHQYSATGKGADYGAQSQYIDLDWRNEVIVPPPPPVGGEMKYRVTYADGVKIRTGAGTSFPQVGLRAPGEIVMPLETKGDTTYPGAYWARDALGWSAVQYYADNRYLMEPFV